MMADGNRRENGKSVIYLAGGCFWGMEKLMKSIPGVRLGHKRLCKRSARSGAFL